MPSGFSNKPPFVEQLAGNLASNVSGIVSAKPTAKYASGARCILKINNRIAGFAFGISWRINTMATEINTIDDYLPYEIAPQRITVEGSISALHIPGTSAGTELWQPDVLAFLMHKYITIEVRDVYTDDLLFLTTKAMITTRMEDIKVDQLSSVQLTFKAIGFRDERDPTLPTQSNGEDGPLGAVKGFLKKLPF
jgi:hypothetical protein